MVTVRVSNRYVDIAGLGTGAAKKLDRATSYRVEGYQYDPRFKRRIWDGYEHLLAWRSKDRCWRLPIGLRDELVQLLRREGLAASAQVTDDPDRLEPPALHLPWTGPELRDYQEEAVAAFTDMGRGRAQGKGILSLPIRSGKTLTAAAVASALGTTAIFMVPSQLLLGQTVRALSGALGADVGVIGEGVWDPKPVTVATVQSLARRRTKRIADAAPEYLDLLRRFGLVVFDEVHHLTGTQWHKVLGDFDARYRLGLSATVFLEDKREVARGVIWLKASTGAVAYEVGMSRLIEAGWLLRPDVKLHKVAASDVDLSGMAWSHALKRLGIYANHGRNQLIADLAVGHARAGRKTLVVSKSLPQVADLRQRISDAGVACEAMVGTTPAAEREHLIARFVAGNVPVLVGTVFGEGVDIPECEAVINADGGRDRKATIQRMRCLTPSPGKAGAWVDDFIDMANPYLARHSLERLQVYRSELAFAVQIVQHGT